VGLSRFELLTPRLSSVCSNQLSYRPSSYLNDPFLQTPTCQRTRRVQPLVPSKLDRALHNQTVKYQIDLSIVRLRALRRFVETL
jgi:hypothetical protein